MIFGAPPNKSKNIKLQDCFIHITTMLSEESISSFKFHFHFYFRIFLVNKFTIHRLNLSHFIVYSENDFTPSKGHNIKCGSL